MRSRLTVVCVMAAVLLLVASGCGWWVTSFTEHGKLEKAAREAYERESYDQAVFLSSRSLRSNPEYERAQILVQDAFRAAVGMHRRRINQLEASAGESRWDEVVSEYEALMRLNEAIEGLPTLRAKRTGEIIRFELADYSHSLTEAKFKAAEVHYQAGDRLSQNREIGTQKQAAKEFRAALHFVPNYRDASSRYEQCRRAAIKRMVILPFEDRSQRGSSYGAISETITDEIIANVMSDPTATEFLELVSRGELDRVLAEHRLQYSGLVDEQTAVRVGELLGVHELLAGQITQIVYAAPRTTQGSITRTARVVVRKEKYRDEKGKEHERDIHGDVQATVIIYTKATSASIIGSYRIVDVGSARILQASSFEGKAEFQCQWATFSGDERALTDEDKRLRARGEGLLPVETAVVLQAARNLSESLAGHLKTYVR